MRKVTIEKAERVIDHIHNEALSLRKALKKEKLSFDAFYKWIEMDEKNHEQFTRARKNRADILFDECLEIADDDGDDEKPFVGTNHIQRDKLKIETRLKMVARMYPKKYGDKIDVTSKGEKVEVPLFPDVVIPKKEE